MKVVINCDYGGFGLSDEAFRWLIDNKGWKITHYVDGNPADPDADVIKNEEPSSFGDYYPTSKHDYQKKETRTNPDIIEVVETLGSESKGRFASLRIVEIPDDIEWEIDEYDGWEHIAEKHRTWP